MAESWVWRKGRGRTELAEVCCYSKETNLRPTEMGFRMCCQGTLVGSSHTQGLFWCPSGVVCREGEKEEEKFASLFQRMQCGFGMWRPQHFLASWGLAVLRILGDRRDINGDAWQWQDEALARWFGIGVKVQGCKGNRWASRIPRTAAPYLCCRIENCVNRDNLRATSTYLAELGLLKQTRLTVILLLRDLSYLRRQPLLVLILITGTEGL